MTDNRQPTIDGRRREALRRAAVERARSYTPEWDPDEGDVGTALLGLFAEITEGVLERVDRAPEKHRLAFFDALGFDRDPPQPAKLPLVFDVAEGLDTNVRITTGTQAVAPPPDDGSEITFEIPDGGGFEATPARLDSVVSVSPTDDAVFVHHDALADDDGTTLFTGRNEQEHLLYVGHANFFELTSATEFEVTLAGDGTDVFGTLDWQFFGEKEVDGEAVERWHPLPIRTRDHSETDTTLRFKLNEGEAFVATTLPTDEQRLVGAEAVAAAEADGPPRVTDAETLWIRCVAPPTLGDALFETTVSTLSLSLVTADDGVEPQMLLANDVPLATDVPPANETKTLPFGEMPLPLDAFYVASDEAFSKTETPIELVFDGMSGGLRPRPSTSHSPDYSWEYWNGSGWARLPLTVDDSENDEETIRFVVPEDIAPTAVSGHEHHWIRVRVLEDGNVRYEAETTTNEANQTVPTGVWEMIHDTVPSFEGLSIHYPEPKENAEGGGSKVKSPDHVVGFNNGGYGADAAKDLSPEANAEPTTETTDESTMRPFKRLPDALVPEPTEVLYLGFDGPLDDGPIQLLYSAADKPFPVPFYPRARWEYCENPENDTWTPLVAEDGTEGLLRRGIVSLSFPEATTAFERFGRVRHWVRTRLVGDQFEATVTENAAVEEVEADDDPSIDIRIDEQRGVAVIESRGVQTFGLEDYRLSLGPRSNARELAAVVSPSESLVVPIEQPTGAVELLTPDSKSVRVRVRRANLMGVRNRLADGDEFEREWGAVSVERTKVDRARGVEVEGKTTGRGTSDPGETEPVHPTACESLTPPVVETDTEATKVPPSLRGIYPNAGWAHNVVTVAGEVLGSSDGTAGQTFAFASRPAIDVSVWVDELAALSESERTALRESETDVEELRDGDESLTAFWVRWTRVEDFTESTDDDRHYLLDRIDGRLTFGDGTNGATPPPGEENVRADYRTGGGVAGNVPPRTVEALVSAIPHVEGVWNPDAGGGGADAETTAEAAPRAARTLEDRNRAVARADFERIAASASRELARVRCLPGLDRSNTARAGHVTVLLVPRSSERRPTPNAELKATVEDALRRHAPVPVTHAAGETDENRLHVRGPNYVEVGVDATVAVDETTADSVSSVETSASTRLTEFFHPLTGGPDAAGWPFGELPCVSDAYAVLEGVPGVDHVSSLALTFYGSERGYTVSDDDRLPAVPTDSLVCSAAHTVQATREPQPGTDSDTDEAKT